MFFFVPPFVLQIQITDHTNHSHTAAAARASETDPQGDDSDPGGQRQTCREVAHLLPASHAGPKVRSGPCLLHEMFPGH